MKGVFVIKTRKLQGDINVSCNTNGVLKVPFSKQESVRDRLKTSRSPIDPKVLYSK